MRYTVVIIILLLVFSELSAKKETRIYSIVNSSDICRLGKQMKIWDADNDDIYETLTLTLCETSRELNYTLVAEYEPKLYSGLRAELQQGALESDYFRIKIYNPNSLQTVCIITLINKVCYMSSPDSNNPAGGNITYKTEKLEFFPNPFKNTFYFSINDDFDAGLFKIELIDMKGERVFSCTNYIYYKGQNVAIFIDDIKEGAYLVYVKGMYKQYLSKIICLK